MNKQISLLDGVTGEFPLEHLTGIRHVTYLSSIKISNFKDITGHVEFKLSKGLNIIVRGGREYGYFPPQSDPMTLACGLESAISDTENLYYRSIPQALRKFLT